MPEAALSEATSFARTRDGIQVAYRIYGEGDRPLKIALVHSLAMDHSFWREVAPLLAPRADVLVYDCRGHGRSDKAAGPYRVEQFGDDLADLLDAVGWREAAVAGASMGGCVALAFAARHGSRTSGLGLIDTTDYYGPEAPKAWAERGQKARDSGMEALVEFQKTRWFGDRFVEERPDVLAQALEVFVANDVAAYAETCAMLGACDLRSALPQFSMPVSIVVGEEDYATPLAMAQSMHERIADSRLRVIEGARHFTPLEVPGIIAEELLGLLDRIGER